MTHYALLSLDLSNVGAGKLTKDVGQTGFSQAEEFEVRERKQSLVNFSSDPFQLLTGTGHRQSVSGGVVSGAAAEARRRSSLVPGFAAAAAAKHRSGYDGDKNLGPIQSRPEGAAVSSPSGTNGAAYTPHPHHDMHDPDSVAPHET